jgi:glyoxylase-like metal-dependent hydrolase (beta-lactamase superfamily II)
MKEIAPGLWHWTARHPHIEMDVSSYYLAEARVALDPLLPPEGISWFEEHGQPEHVLMTNRHHDRHGWELQERFGCAVHCVRNGMHEIEGRGSAEPFDFGDELPGGITPNEIGGISPDETALAIPRYRALACADGVMHYGGSLGFVPDQYMDQPDQTKQDLRAAYRRVLELYPDFDLLLVAHGDPVIGGASEALRRFAA